MMMPANFSAISENEMTYVNGGASLSEILAPELKLENWQKFNQNMVTIIGNSFLGSYVSNTVGTLFGGAYKPGNLGKAWFSSVGKYYQGGYDAVVCVHVIPAMMMTALKQAWSACPVFCFVATDYTCSPTVGACTPDICVIPHQELADEFVSCGIARDTLLPAGIPVRSAFRQHGDRAAARRALGLPETGRHIVLMSGSIGCGPMGDVAEDLDMRMADGDFATVLCGSNKQMRYALELRRLYRVEAVGFTTQVQLYMDSADVLVSKPGGISITEAACKGVPMLLADLVGGCETRNQAFFAAHGWAELCDTGAIADSTLSLLADNARRQALAAVNDLMRAYKMLDLKLNDTLLNNIMILGLQHAVYPLEQDVDTEKWEIP